MAKPNPDEFQLIDPLEFEKLDFYINKSNTSETPKYNYCDMCNIPMSPILDGFECPNCHIVKHIVGGIKDCSEESGGVIKMSNGAGTKSIYSSVPDNSKAQKKQVLEQLTKLNEAYKDGPKIPLNIIDTVASEYNNIQKLNIEKYDENGEICGQKKFVRRGSIKDEVLGALLFYSCMKVIGQSRKRKDIAEFMKLQENGISRGETILRDLHNEKKISIAIQADPSHDFARRYLDSLGLLETDDYGDLNDKSERYLNFVTDIVEVSFGKKILMNSMRSSKIVGAIYVLVVREKLSHITISQIENSCDNIRRNTFMKFANIVLESYPSTFCPIFEKYKIANMNIGIHKRTPVKTLEEVEQDLQKMMGL
jgi:Zn finger protein HypA/HybF involved in hydrogenase expression